MHARNKANEGITEKNAVEDEEKIINRKCTA